MVQRWVIGVLLIGHGFLHLLGFMTSWDLVETEGISRTPTILADDLPTGVIRDIGALWLLGLVAFAIAGYGVIQDYRWWKAVALGSAIVSLVATIFWIHEAWPGIVLNLIIITLIARSRFGEETRRQQASSPGE